MVNHAGGQLDRAAIDKQCRLADDEHLCRRVPIPFSKRLTYVRGGSRSMLIVVYPDPVPHMNTMLPPATSLALAQSLKREL